MTQATHETSCPQELPRNRTGVLSPPRARQLSRSTEVVVSFSLARVVKIFLYFWSVVAIVLGILLSSFIAFLLFFKTGGDVAPTLPFRLAAYGGLSITLASCFGLYGLVQHRQLVTFGQRNYSLGMCIVLGTIGASVTIIAGGMAISFVQVVDLALGNKFTNDRVVDLELNVLSKVYLQVKTSASSWTNTQRTLECCGYAQKSTIEASVRARPGWDPSLQVAIEDVNAIGGTYCTSECVETMVSGNYCPISGHEWCRLELLRVARENYSILSLCAISVGGLQLLISAFGVFTLLCDVRRLKNSSPIHEIPPHTLAPIQLKNTQ